MSHLPLFAPGPDFNNHPGHNTLPHVLLVVDGFPKALGGGERIVLRLAALLPRFGFRVSLLTFAVHAESTFRPADAPCPVYLLPLTNTYGFQALRGALVLGRFLREQQVSVVQTFFESSDLWAGVVTRCLSPAKLVWSRRDMGILRTPKHSRAYRALRRLPHAVSAVSRRVAQHVIDVDGVPPERVHVVYNGLDLPPTSQRPHPAQAGTVGTIGNIRQVKGHDLLAEAAASVVSRYPSTTFAVAGEILEPDFFQNLRSRITSLHLQNHFRFLGKVSDLNGFLATITIFVLPSRSEGFSNALIEAMAAGLPCIATDVGGNAEAIQDGVNGLIVPAKNARALAAAIEQLLGDPERAARLGQAAQRMVGQSFSAEAMMRQVTSIYHSLLRA